MGELLLVSVIPSFPRRGDPSGSGVVAVAFDLVIRVAIDGKPPLPLLGKEGITGNLEGEPN